MQSESENLSSGKKRAIYLLTAACGVTLLGVVFCVWAMIDSEVFQPIKLPVYRTPGGFGNLHGWVFLIEFLAGIVILTLSAICSLILTAYARETARDYATQLRVALLTINVAQFTAVAGIILLVLQ